MRQMLTLALCVVFGDQSLARQLTRTTVDRVVVGDAIILQGCVQRAVNPSSHVLTGVVQWPLVRQDTGPFGLRHYWANHWPIDLDSFVGETIQIEGTVASIEPSEIELEPGLRKFGKFVEFERPGGNVLVSPNVAGIDPAKRQDRADVPITLIEVDISKAFRVLQGCLPHAVNQR